MPTRIAARRPIRRKQAPPSISTRLFSVSAIALLGAAAGAAVALLGTQLFAARRRAATLPQLQEREEALRASESRFEGILSIAADAIITADADQRILHFNWGAEQIFGYVAAEIIGQPLNVLLPERFRKRHDAYIADFADAPETARRMGHRREIFGLRKTGEEFPAEAAISKLNSPSEMLFTVVLRDVTERKRAESRLRFLATSSALLASSLDMEETLQTVAEIARPTLADCALLDYAPEGADRRWIASGHDDDTRERVLLDIAGEIAGEGAAWAGVFPVPASRPEQPAPSIVYDSSRLDDALILGDRERAVVERLGVQAVLVVPLAIADRALGRLLLFATGPRALGPDIELAGELGWRCATALESAQLFQSAHRATRARDEMLGVVSHDLRNPINAIAMLARVLADSPPQDSADRVRMLGAITQATELTNRMIQDLLDVASIEAGRLSMEQRYETADIMVNSAMSMLAPEALEKRQDVDVDIAPSLPALHADAGRIVQVLANLIGNAVKFTPPGGRIVVRAEPGDGAVRFSVSDTGPGIPDDEHAFIFERFWQGRRVTGRHGSGLGLAIAKGIVEAHGGRIWVESVPGSGSTFSFTLPAARIRESLTPPGRLS